MEAKHREEALAYSLPFYERQDTGRNNSLLFYGKQKTGRKQFLFPFMESKTLGGNNSLPSYAKQNRGRKQFTSLSLKLNLTFSAETRERIVKA